MRNLADSFRILALFLLISLPCSVIADSRLAHESQVSRSELPERIKSVLERVDRGQFIDDPETTGYDFLYRSSFFSPFDYRIYGGQVSEKVPVTIIRVEGSAGEARTIERILEQENFFKDSKIVPGPYQSIGYKYQAITHPLNIIAPWGAVLYQSRRSPLLSKGQTWFRFLFYLSTDLFFIYAGGTNWFQQGKWEGERYKENIIAGMAVMRVISAVQLTNLTRAHNRVAKLGYTFHF